MLYFVFKQISFTVNFCINLKDIIYDNVYETFWSFKIIIHSKLLKMLLKNHVIRLKKFLNNSFTFYQIIINLKTINFYFKSFNFRS